MSERFDEFMAFRTRVQKAEGNRAATDALIAEQGARTSDGVPVTVGLPVTDYDRRATTVTGIQTIDFTETGPFNVWFSTENGGMFDGSRLQYRRIR